MQQEPGSITHWLSKLQAGQAQAAEPIWKRYQAKLVSIARQQLDENPDCSVDGEDLVQSSFGNVCLAVQNGKYPDIDNREDLWGLLYIATVNRVREHYRERRALKRFHISSSQAIDPSILADLQYSLCRSASGRPDRVPAESIGLGGPKPLATSNCLALSRRSFRQFDR